MSEAATQPGLKELPPQFKTFRRKNGSEARIRVKPKETPPAADKPKETPAPAKPSSGWVAPVVAGVLVGGCLLVAAVAVVKHSANKSTQQNTMH